MPVIVATITPKPEHVDEVVAAFEAYIPSVHTEPGCERYSLHRGDDGTLVMIEKWATDADLATHSTSDAYKAFGASLRDLVAARPDVKVLQAVPAGDGAKGAL